MNLPNRLTILRILLIPLCILFLLLRWDIPAALVFVFACMTDYWDGHLARKKGLVTNFGKFADPVADKILVISVMVVLLAQHRFPWWALCIVVIRELAVDGLRLIAIEQGLVIAAGPLGKYKTVCQMAGVLAAILNAPVVLVMVLCVVLSALTIISGVKYFIDGKSLLDPHDSPAC